jgi:Prenyltransferase and squalene oxidase repeat
VSWQLTSFLILGAVLLGGFAWYERSRPPAQVVALVAALAALAIAGRIAFAAFPNVKPTTDIVIFAGYALGAAPGFAVGALAALVSNFWFGQGPWTPWQMAGWGFCGILGAVLALGVRNAGRLSLAATCGAAGIFYGALLNFSLMATYGGDLSLERFGVLMTRALPFDLAHAAGNVAFALIAGPAMVRMLVRFRERFEWRRAARGGAPAAGGLAPGLGASGIAALLVLAFCFGALAPAAEADGPGIERATAWLVANQNSDGGFGSSPEDDSGTDITAWSMLALEAVGRNPFDVARGGRTPVDFLRAHLDQVKSPGDLARTILALEGAGADPRDFGGANLVSQLLAKRRSNGSYEGWPGSTSFAAIALRAAGATGSLGATLDWLRQAQNEDGGWGDLPGSPSTADGTGAAMQALSPDSKAVRRGLSYLRENQRKGGGFPLGNNGTVNTQSTAWAIQGILAAGADLDSYRRGGKSALDYIAAQQADDGHYRYSKQSDQTPIWVTSYGITATAEKHFPIAAPPRAPKPKVSASQANTGGLIPGLTPETTPTVPSTPSVPLPSQSPSTGSGGGSGGNSIPFPLPGQAPKPGGSAAPVLPGGIVPPGTGPGAEEPPIPGEEAPVTTTELAPEEDDSEGSAAGAAGLGLLAGALLCAAAYGVRRLWMRWRYGL